MTALLMTGCMIGLLCLKTELAKMFLENREMLHDAKYIMNE